MSARSLLIELLVEELPPKALGALGEAFASDIFAHLRKLDFLEAASVKTVYASPRRLATHITAVRDRCADVPIRKKLVPVHVAYDAQGQASPALLKRLEKEEAKLDETVRAFEDGKEFVWLDRIAPGRPLADVLEAVVTSAIANLPIPKVMGYQLSDGWTTVRFVRPAHALMALHGSEVLPLSVLGLNSGRKTSGHRFEAAVDPVIVADADSYAETLRGDGAVIAGFAERRAEIVRQLAAAAGEAGSGLRPIEDEALLDEVTALVERPNVLIGRFEPEFLAVPQECLILTMKANQKYFPLLDAAGKLSNQFLVVSNIRPADPSAVIGGNERVVRPRLADAKFFYDQDRKRSLESRVPGLAKVVYHNKLGTQAERAQRVAAIARSIGTRLGGETLALHAERAAVLAKADLLTDMVGEFPELQGIMGRYYALHDGYDHEIADAIEDHYKPRFAGDSLPRGTVGTVVALADKLETLIGMFGIGQIPTGDKDPFALRRHALGVIRMLAEKDLPLALDVLIGETVELMDQQLTTAGSVISASAGHGGGQHGSSMTRITRSLAADTQELLTQFIYERLAGNLREQGYTAQEIDAVIALRPQRLGEIPKRLAAVRAFSALAEAASLAAANKRVGNILKKTDGAVQARIAPDLLLEAAEVSLNLALAEVRPKAAAAFAIGDYTASLQALAALRVPVDTFFTEVMVNVEDPALRANRLGLLAVLHQAMNQVADLSRLSA